MKRLLFILAFSLLPVAFAEAAIKFVDNTVGCPSTGGVYCSIQNAMSSAVAGDDIKIRSGNGVYSETVTVSGKNGTSLNPIILEPDIGASFVIRNTAAASATAAIEIDESDYWTIRNLVFNAAGVTPGFYALKIQCQTKSCVGIQVLNNQFLNWRQSLAYTTWGPDVLYIAGDGSTPATHFITATVDSNLFSGNEDNAIYLVNNTNTAITNNEITDQRCGADDNGSDVRWIGIYLLYKNTGITISGNRIHDFQSYAQCGRTLSPFPTLAGIWCDVGDNTDFKTVIKNNSIYNLDQNGAPTDLSKQVHGMFIEAGCSGYTVEQNLIYGVRTYGISNSFHSGAATVPNLYYNNTIYNTGWGLNFKEGLITSKNNIVSNASQAQLCIGCTSGNPSFVSLTSDYNLYYDGGTGTKTAEWSGIGTLNFANWKTQCKCDTNAKIGNPLFVSTSTPDFHLQAGSPARGAGIDVGFGTDIGALPFASGGVVTWTNDRFPGVTSTARGTATWSTDTPTGTPLANLLPGINDITVTATDVNGNAGIATRRIIYAPTFPGNTLAGAWAFDEGSGTTAADSSGNGNTGAIINGAPWVTGVHGTAISLDGVSQFVTVSGSVNNTLNYTQSFTFSAWVFPRSVRTDYRTIFEKSSSYGTIYGLFSSTSSYCGAGNIVGLVTTDGGFTPSASVCDLSSPLPTNQWTHLAVTYDTANLRLYRNAVLIQTTAKSGYIEPSTGSLAIGAHPSGVQVFDGLIDDARTYNWAIPLTAGSNTVPGAACTFGNPLDPLQQSVVRDMNCPVIASTPPIFVLKVGPSATAIKIGPSSTAIKLGPQ